MTILAIWGSHLRPGNRATRPVLAAGLLFGLMAPVPGHAQTGADVVDRHGNWSVLCATTTLDPAAPACEIAQTVRRHGEAVPVLRVSLACARGREACGMFLVLPAGIRAEAGIVIRLEGGKDMVALPVARCGPANCVAQGVVPLTAIAGLGVATRAVVVMTDAQGSLSGIPFSLEGVAAALEVMMARNGA